MEADVWSVVLYGCKTLSAGKEDTKTLTSFEHRCYRRVLHINWRDRMSIDEVFRT